MLHECDEVVRLYLCSTTQWERDRFGCRVRLNYTGVETVARINGIELTQERFGWLQAIEREIIEIDKEALRHANNHG